MTLKPETLLAEARDELTRADGKASIMFAALGVAAAALGAAILGGSWRPEALPSTYQDVWWVGTAFAGASGLSFAGAVWPRVAVALPLWMGWTNKLLRFLRFRRVIYGKPDVARYFDEVALIGDSDDVAAALARTTAEGRSLQQLVAVSLIVRKKYVLIRRGIFFLIVAVGLLVAAGVGGH